MKSIWKYIKLLLAVFLCCFVVVNWNAWGGLFHFMKTYLTYEYESPSPITKGGHYHEMFELVQLNSEDRIGYIADALDRMDIAYRIDSIGLNQANVFVYGDITKPISIITAHHDVLEREGYQGALDNTGSVNILLHLCEEIDFKEQPIAILFTGLEERRMMGASYFMEHTAQELNLDIKEAICLDGVGKGKLAVMNNGSKFGYKFRDHLFREQLFSGKYFRSTIEYTPYPTDIIDLRKHDIKALKSFVSSTDAKVFVEAGIPTLQLVSSNIYHFMTVLHTNKDRIETIDEPSLLQCEQILKEYIKKL